MGKSLSFLNVRDVEFNQRVKSNATQGARNSHLRLIMQSPAVLRFSRARAIQRIFH